MLIDIIMSPSQADIVPARGNSVGQPQVGGNMNNGYNTEILLPSEGILIGFHVLSFWYVEELCSSQDKPIKAEDGNVHLNCKL